MGSAMKNEEVLVKREDEIVVLMRKQVGKDAAAILNEVDRMLKQGADHTRIKKAVATKLCAHLRKQMTLFMQKNIPRVCP